MLFPHIPPSLRSQDRTWWLLDVTGRISEEPSGTSESPGILLLPSPSSSVVTASALAPCNCLCCCKHTYNGHHCHRWPVTCTPGNYSHLAVWPLLSVK